MHGGTPCRAPPRKSPHLPRLPAGYAIPRTTPFPRRPRLAAVPIPVLASAPAPGPAPAPARPPRPPRCSARLNFRVRSGSAPRPVRLVPRREIRARPGSASAPGPVLGVTQLSRPVWLSLASDPARSSARVPRSPWFGLRARPGTEPGLPAPRQIRCLSRLGLRAGCGACALSPAAFDVALVPTRAPCPVRRSPVAGPVWPSRRMALAPTKPACESADPPCPFQHSSHLTLPARPGSSSYRTRGLVPARPRTGPGPRPGSASALGPALVPARPDSPPALGPAYALGPALVPARLPRLARLTSGARPDLRSPRAIRLPLSPSLPHPIRLPLPPAPTPGPAPAPAPASHRPLPLSPPTSRSRRTSFGNFAY
ncbi:hypothetical protein SAMN02745830_05903 [Streptomyces sp. Amel2xC10]|nr:hypothetical protein SAMN02745830_05903 [Streptomyces sp. Amel2xC10]